MVDGAGAPLAYGGLLAIKGLWDSWRSHRFGIYGIWGTGKTTLNNYLSTPGEIEDDDEAFATTLIDTIEKKDNTSCLYQVESEY